LERTITLSYTDHNRLDRITYPAGEYLQMSYSDGSVERVTQKYHNADGSLYRAAVTEYDPDHLQPVSSYLDSLPQKVAQYNYNGVNDLIQFTSYGQFGAETSATEYYGYTNEGLLKSITDSLGGNTNFVYDKLQRLTQVSDPNQGVTQYTYTGWGELKETQSPDTGTTQYQLDSRGLTTQIQHANGHQAQFTYDAANRPVTIDYNGTDQDAVLTYDEGTFGKGRLTSVSDGSGNSQYQYDDRGLVTQHQSTITGISLNAQYAYNTASDLTGITYPSGLNVQYQYDANGKLTAVVGNENGSSIGMIDQLVWKGDQLQSYQYANGLTTLLDYDSAGRLLEKSVRNTSTLFLNRVTLDKQSQVLQQQWTLSTDKSSFSYDKLGRLNSENNDTQSLDWQYNYDPVGNRLVQQTSDASTTNSYSYDANSNRLNTVNSDTVVTDASGNILDDGVRQYGYNNMNRLAQINRLADGQQTDYTYNYLGQRVRKVGSGSINSDIRYLYGPSGILLGEYDANGDRIREYIYQAETGYPELVAMVDASGTVYNIHTDHLKTPRWITDDSQNIVWQWRSDAFGNGIANEDVDGDGQLVKLNHRFPGQQYDSETGLHYNYYRDYDPRTGRY
ncbi:MAG: RHS repeat-associated core domain-containing protein, partial [Neptuniibacter sp.]